MKNRRQFAKALGLGAIAGSLRIPAVWAQEKSPPDLDRGNGKPVRIGIIGAENSHTIRFGRVFNQQKVFPGVSVVAVWGETREFAQKASQAGSIPRIVERQEELLEIADAIIIDHRHAKYHGAAAVPFLEAGIPTFIDKPFTYRTEQARHILDLAEKHGTPITCLSSIGFGPTVDDLFDQINGFDDLSYILVTGPADIKSKYGGIFFYGIHLVERLFRLFGDDVIAVRATRHRSQTTFQFKFSSGYLATAVLANDWRVYCLIGDQLREIQPRIEIEDDTLYLYSAMVRMFQTGEEPRSYESIIRTVAALEAMERSISSEMWEYPLI